MSVTSMVPVIREIILVQKLRNMELSGNPSEEKAVKSFIEANRDSLKHLETASEDVRNKAEKYFKSKDGEDITHAAWRCYDDGFKTDIKHFV